MAIHPPLYNLRHDPRLHLFLRLTANIPKHAVHLLERLARRLRHTEEREHKRKQTKHREERVRACTCVLDQGWRDEALCALAQCRGMRYKIGRGDLDLQ
jgi:hypothetical protein